MKRKAILVISVLLMAALLTACGDGGKYKKAISLYESGSYEEAAAIFAELGDYEDSAERLQDCQYWHSFITDAEYRRYEPDGASASMFLLDVQGTYFLDLQDEKLVKQEATDSKPQKAKYLVTLLDENTLQFDTFDPISGNAAAASEPMLFVKSTKERPENSFDIPVDDSSPAHDLPTERPDASALTSNIEDGASTGERNALQTAKDYLSVMAFSYTGLIEQLEYEGYSHSEAVYGADNCGADWFEQAAKSAKQYLEFMSFSRSSLIEQLEYEGFTHEQAIYGAEMNGY